jgi:hypothetical protein
MRLKSIVTIWVAGLSVLNCGAEADMVGSQAVGIEKKTSDAEIEKYSCLKDCSETSPETPALGTPNTPTEPPGSPTVAPIELEVDLKINGLDEALILQESHPALLSWTSANATSCSLQGPQDSPTEVALTGQLEVPAALSGDYTLTCAVGDQQSNDRVDLTVFGIVSANLDAYYDPQLNESELLLVGYQNSFTLSYTSANAETCELLAVAGSDPAGVVLATTIGSIVVDTATANQKYRLTCKNPFGIASDEVEIQVQFSNQDVARICSETPAHQKLVFEQILHFPERQECSFGENGNGPIQNGEQRAREAQLQKVSLPDNGIICDLTRFRSIKKPLPDQDDFDTDAEIHYDDFLFLTLNDFVLMGSNSVIVDKFDKKGDMPIWDWTKVYGSSFEGENSSFCLGDGSCQIPGHDKKGPINLELDAVATHQLSAELTNLTEAHFSVIATGDNDPGDCFHTDITIDMSLNYIVLKP